MNTFFKILAIIFIMLGFAQANFAQSEDKDPGTKLKTKKWSVSLFTGKTVFASGENLKHMMRDNGFADPIPVYVENSPDWWNAADKRSHLATKSFPSFEIGFQYHFTRHSAIGISYGRMHKLSVSGFDLHKIIKVKSVYIIPFFTTIAYEYHHAIGNEITITCSLDKISIPYVFVANKCELSFGPQMGFAKVIIADDPVKMKSVIAGIEGSFSTSVIDVGSFAIGIKMNYSMMPKVNIGPYLREVTYVEDSGTKTFTSVFQVNKLSMSSSNVGLFVRFKK